MFSHQVTLPGVGGMFSRDVDSKFIVVHVHSRRLNFLDLLILKTSGVIGPAKPFWDQYEGGVSFAFYSFDFCTFIVLLCTLIMKYRFTTAHKDLMFVDADSQDRDPRLGRAEPGNFDAVVVDIFCRKDVRKNQNTWTHRVDICA